MHNVTVLAQLRKLTAQLFPNGRAFRVHKDSIKQKIVDAISIEQANFVAQADGILDHILPDNDNFTVYDATLWEARLGINSNPNTSLADRKAAIIQKLNHPGNILARQSAGYLQDQLQLAGFNVYVHDNLQNLTVQQVLSVYNQLPQAGNFQAGQAQAGGVMSYFGNLFQVVQAGQFQAGQVQAGQMIFQNRIANKIDVSNDILSYNVERTFFIGGATLGQFANVDASRMDEFRQLILQLKPARSVGILLINYV